MNKRIWFAQMLRAYAAFLVYITHCVLGFWTAPQIIPTLIQTPAIEYQSSIHQIISTYLDSVYIGFGALGVAIFFLISGFVIPFSLEHYSIKQFLVKRFFRIFPTYMTGLAITCLILIYSAHYIGEEFKHSFYHYFINGTLFFQYILNIPSIDYLNWTLIVEVYFYVTFAVFFTCYLVKHPQKIFIYPVLILIIGILLQQRKIYSFLWITPYLIFMSIGTIIFQHYMKRIVRKQMVKYIGITLCCMFIYIYIYHKTSIHSYLVNYLLALIIFILCYIYNDKLPYSKFINFIAEISYPLYIIHGVGSYAIMSISYTKYSSMPLSLLASLCFSLGFALLLHYTIENPTIKLGNKLAKKIAPKQ